MQPLPDVHPHDVHPVSADAHRLARGRWRPFSVALAALVALVLIVAVIGARLRLSAAPPAAPLIIISYGGTVPPQGYLFSINLTGVNAQTGHALWHDTEILEDTMTLYNGFHRQVQMAGGMLYILTEDSHTLAATLIARSASDGHLLWRASTGFAGTPIDALLVADATGAYLILTTATATQITAYAAADGHARWHLTEPVSDVPSSISVAHTLLAALVSRQTGHVGTLLAIATASGIMRWQAASFDFGPLFVSNGIVYGDGEPPTPTSPAPLTAWRLADGHVLWQQSLAVAPGIFAQTGGVVIEGSYAPCCTLVADYTATITALQTTTGAVIWQHTWRQVMTASGPELLHPDFALDG